MEENNESSDVIISLEKDFSLPDEIPGVMSNALGFVEFYGCLIFMSHFHSSLYCHSLL